MGIGKRLKKKRLEKNLTLEELGKAANVSRATVQRYESGVISNIPSDKIEAMAKRLDVSPGYIMGWEEEPYTESEIYELNSFLNEYGVEIKLVNEEDPDWAVIFNGSYRGNNIDSLWDIYSNRDTLDSEDIQRELDAIFPEYTSDKITTEEHSDYAWVGRNIKNLKPDEVKMVKNFMKAAFELVTEDNDYEHHDPRL